MIYISYLHKHHITMTVIFRHQSRYYWVGKNELDFPRPQGVYSIVGEIDMFTNNFLLCELRLLGCVEENPQDF